MCQALASCRERRPRKGQHGNLHLRAGARRALAVAVRGSGSCIQQSAAFRRGVLHCASQVVLLCVGRCACARREQPLKTCIDGSTARNVCRVRASRTHAELCVDGRMQRVQNAIKGTAACEQVRHTVCKRCHLYIVTDASQTTKTASVSGRDKHRERAARALWVPDAMQHKLCCKRRLPSARLKRFMIHQ
jgi:hypothetical protein